MRYKLADANDPRDFEFDDRIRHNRGLVEQRLRVHGAQIHEIEQETDYAYRVTFEYDGELKELTDLVEDVPGRRGALARALARDHQGPRRRRGGLDPVRPRRTSRARTRSGTCGWRPSRTSTSRARTPTGPTRSATSRSCTTAS